MPCSLVEWLWRWRWSICLHQAGVWISLPRCCRQLDFLKYPNPNDGDNRIRYPSAPCYQTTRRHIPADSNFRVHHRDNMKSHFIQSSEPASALFLQPILKFMQLRLSFLVYFKRSPTLFAVSHSLYLQCRSVNSQLSPFVSNIRCTPSSASLLIRHFYITVLPLKYNYL